MLRDKYIEINLSLYDCITILDYQLQKSPQVILGQLASAFTGSIGGNSKGVKGSGSPMARNIEPVYVSLDKL